MSDSQKRVSGAVIVLLVFAGLLTSGMAFRQMFKEVQAVAQESSLHVYGQLPDCALQRETGEPFTLTSLRGKVWIADFVFTRCAGPCPRMTQAMARLQDNFEGLEGLRLVTFSVDPDYDSPEVLRRYGEMFSADPARWYFLTGDRERIYKLSIESFKLSVGDDPSDEHLILHSTRFVLVDRLGRIRGYYDETEPDQMRQLAADARLLLGAGSHR